MTRRLTEADLDARIDAHAEQCDDCGAGRCDERDRIEAEFWNEVDRRIDEAKERGWDR